MRLETLSAVAKNVLDLEGVVGVGASRTLKIFVESEEHADAVATSLAGRPVQVIVTGRLRALPATADRRGRVRPLVGGISISPDTVKTAGTLGAVHDGWIITNAHVLAMDLDGNYLRSAKILQPGLIDGGTLEDVVGELVGYTRITFNDSTAENYVDLAVGRATVEYLNDTVLGNAPYRVTLTPYEPGEGEVVRKSGRTTGETTGTVVSTSAVVKVWYSEDKWAAFHDVIMVRGNPFSAPGDSGSFVDKDGKFVGLVFAGNELTGYGVVCKAKYVLYALKQLTQGTAPEEKPSFVPAMAFFLPLLPIMVARRRRA
jgi:hypothetical protein